ncbi:MAG: DUF2986 domain-containing protein [Chitinophagaceae bacterium]|nr:DUF2986 domain-containing protein [Chitinophagaceae bacterium]
MKPTRLKLKRSNKKFYICKAQRTTMKWLQTEMLQ